MCYFRCKKGDYGLGDTMKLYRGLICVNIVFACLIFFEIIGYAWLMHKQPSLAWQLDIVCIVGCVIDIIWCVHAWIEER